MISSHIISSSPQDVASVNQFIQKHPNSVIFFELKGCPYCAYVRPLFRDVVNKYYTSDAVAFLAVEVSADAYNLKEAFDFSTVPKFMYFKNGKEVVDRRHGSDNKKLKQDYIEAIIQDLYFKK